MGVVVIPEESFSHAIVSEPTDWFLPLIFADWLEDQGRDREALHMRFCAESRMRPALNRAGRLCWWDDVMERWLSPSAVGKTWLLECCSWTPTNRRGRYLRHSAHAGW